MARPSLDLLLPEPERRRGAALRRGLADFLYAPNPDFTSPLEPGLYRSSFILVMADGQAVRVSSFVVPAFGRELCRLRLEPIQHYRQESLGSFFDPSRRGLIYSMTPGRGRVDTRPPAEAGWGYDGSPLAARLGTIKEVLVVTETVRPLEDEETEWQADRGLVLIGADGEESLLLAEAGPGDSAAFLPTSGIYRALFDPLAPAVPGASEQELLGYGDLPAGTVWVVAQPL
ncbi:MAG TPA: hypothetical protein VFO18_06630 [Methylomirabilota bacterium]|nr:hypothetical protein [Methylomirabilota bacterium]